MTARQQRILLVLALLVTLGLVWFAPEDSNPPPVNKTAKARSTPAAVPRAPTSTARGDTSAASTGVRPSLSLRVREPSDDILSLFRAATWYLPPPPPPPAPPAPPPAPPVPVTPPLPFAYMGQLVEDGVPIYILARGDRVVTVRTGDLIDKIYRLEGSAGGVLTFVYVPLGTKQSLATGVSP